MTFAQPFSNYEILARIGSGAMGTVFKARQKHMNRVVALKVLKPSLARDTRYVDRLQREARIVGKLNHPNIVTGYDLGQEGGYHFFVMEFVEGKSLRQLLSEWGMFPEEQVLDVAIQVASALDHAYECGVIHRDVKPGNVLIDDDGRVKLTDMGLAKVESDLALTREGATVGTPQYISPEQARDPQRADIRSDLYSLGASLFHMATGQPPFRAESIGELITKVLHERPASAIELNPALTDGLSLVIRKLLAKDPALRYQTPRELLVDLRRVSRRERPAVDRAVLDQDAGVESSVAAVGGSRRSTLPVLLAVAGVAIAALIALLAIDRNDVREPQASVPEFERRLTARLRGAGTPAAQLVVLDAARASAESPVELEVIAAEEQRLGTELGRQIAEAIEAWAGERRSETEQWLRETEDWSEPRVFLRERVVPDVEQRIGIRLEDLPATARDAADAAQQALLDALRPLVVERNREFLQRHASFLDGLRREVLTIAEGGEARDALRHLQDGLDTFFGVAGRPPRSRLGPELRAAVAKAEQEARERIEADVRLAQSTLLRTLVTAADRGLAEIEDLRQELDSRGGSPAQLGEELARLERRLQRHRARLGQLLDGTEDPWPSIEARLAEERSAAGSLQRRFDQRVLEGTLDLVYRVLVADGPNAARQLLEVSEFATQEVAARRDRHVAVLAAAADLVAALLEGSDGRVPLVGGGEARVEKLADERVLRSDGGRKVPLVQIDVDRALAALPAAARQQVLARPDRELATALLRLARGEYDEVVGRLSDRDLRFVQQELWPALDAAAAGTAAGAEVEARSAVAAIQRARDAEDVDAVGRGLREFEGRFGGTEVAEQFASVLEQTEDWVRRQAARAQFAAAVRERVPAALEIAVLDDGAVHAWGVAGAMLDDERPEGWSSAGASLAFAGADGAPRPLALQLPVPEPERCEVMLEFELEDRGPEAQLLVIDVAGAVFAIVVLPLGQVAATQLDGLGVTEHPAELRRAVAAPIAEALENPPVLVPFAWHRVTVRAEPRRDGGFDATLRWDGPDGRVLAEGRVHAKSVHGQLRVLPFQPAAVRGLDVVCGPGR